MYILYASAHERDRLHWTKKKNNNNNINFDIGVKYVLFILKYNNKKREEINFDNKKTTII